MSERIDGALSLEPVCKTTIAGSVFSYKPSRKQLLLYSILSDSKIEFI